MFGIVFAALIGLLLLFTQAKYYCKTVFLFSNPAILLTLLVVLVGGVWLCRVLASRRQPLGGKQTAGCG